MQHRDDQGSHRDDQEGGGLVIDERTTFTCGDPKCMATERAQVMYNVTCRPRAITSLAALRQLVRCRSCAEALAAANNRRLGQEGCGTFPLVKTLVAMQRREDDPIPPGSVTYPCAEPDCHIARRAEDMFNVKLGQAVISDVGQILPFIRCGEHARAMAAARGTKPCLPGSDLFRLSSTLEKYANELAAYTEYGESDEFT